MPCPTQYSHLYLCLAGQLAAVICIHDPLRAEAKDAMPCAPRLRHPQGGHDDRRQPPYRRAVWRRR